MPAVGGVKITKKIRFMDFWSDTMIHYGSYVAYNTPTVGKFRRSVIFATEWSGATITSDSNMNDGAIVGEEISLSNIVVDIPNQVFVRQSNIILKCGRVEDYTAAASKIGTYPTSFDYNSEIASHFNVCNGVDDTNGLTLEPGMFLLTTSRMMDGFNIMGNIDVRSIVSKSGTYSVKCVDLHPLGGIKFYDLRAGIRVYFK